ncbi:MAG: hypothetical protein QM346_11420 [Chloroflexota bacterium]|nr:hypothetical protein [Chloroflexota bacterium]
MSKGNTFENDFLKLIFNGTAIANIADNAASDPLANLYVSLHSADVGEGGNQGTNEIAYGDYARVAVVRTSGGWSVSDNEVTNVDPIVFPECASGTATAAYFAVGAAAGGAGKVLYKGQLTNPLNISAGIEPRFDAGDLTITED